MKRWEYRVVSTVMGETYMDYLGQQGWELVARDQQVLTFKRPVKRKVWFLAKRKPSVRIKGVS